MPARTGVEKSWEVGGRRPEVRGRRAEVPTPVSELRPRASAAGCRPWSRGLSRQPLASHLALGTARSTRFLRSSGTFDPYPARFVHGIVNKSNRDARGNWRARNESVCNPFPINRLCGKRTITFAPVPFISSRSASGRTTDGRSDVPTARRSDRGHRCSTALRAANRRRGGTALTERGHTGLGRAPCPRLHSPGGRRRANAAHPGGESVESGQIAQEGRRKRRRAEEQRDFTPARPVAAGPQSACPTKPLAE